MVKPNYAYEKRQKELAKERKKQEKLQRKSQKSDEQQADAPLQTDRPADVSPDEAGGQR